MAFKRAQWHSGLTYKTQCESCHTIVQYTDYSLDFRPWFPDGFVYCPKCQKPLRHNENFAIDREKNVQQSFTLVPGSAPILNKENTNQDNTSNESLFCFNCGRKFNNEDVFCPNCGSKRK